MPFSASIPRCKFSLLSLSLSLLTTSRFSMMYSVISAPPSSFGLAHSRSTKSLSQLVALGFPGFDGGSEGGGEQVIEWWLQMSFDIF